MKAHEEAVFKVRSGLMHYAQGYTTKTDGFISMSLTVHSMGVTFYQWTRTGRTELGEPAQV